MSVATPTADAPILQVSPQEERKVIFASSLGTVFEWYDFYLYATLAPFFAALFFPKGNDTAALLSAFATYAAGFLVRPFGALVFGRLGDMVGRKYTFMVTIIVMGVSTVAVGFLPTYASIGVLAPILLVTLRLLQGLALGGEYGGAATYVAEHAPEGRRGYATSWIQTTATLGFFLSLLVIGVCRAKLSEDAFKTWGWRVPFLISLVLLVFSIYIRARLNESPVFQRMKAQGKGSTSPLRDSFMRYPNNKYVLLALFGAAAGQGVVWYTGQFYALFYLTTILKVETEAARITVAVALLLGMPFFTIFGAMSDRIGRKRIIMTGCLLAALSYVPIYHGMQAAAKTDVVKLSATHDPITDEPKLSAINSAGQIVTAKTDTAYKTNLENTDEIRPGVSKFFDAQKVRTNFPLLVFLIFLQMLLVCMVYGPIAAFLVEAFPAKVRYTSFSLPYHLGNGVFGGMLPLIGLYVNSATKSMYWGLAYPIIVASITFVVGMIALKETRNVRIWDELEAVRAEPPPPAGPSPAPAGAAT
jgi:MFS family permease